MSYNHFGDRGSGIGDQKKKASGHQGIKATWHQGINAPTLRCSDDPIPDPSLKPLILIHNN
jgi:hypothetical protein